MAANVTTYVFGDFRFLPSESLLLERDQAVPLPPKALNLLEKLVRNAGSIVTKDELLRDVWDDMAIEESAIARNVSLIRRVLGDDPKNHTFIQTVPKRGYRFVGEVSTLNGSNGQASPTDTHSEVRPVSAVETWPVSVGQTRRSYALHLATVLLLAAAVTTGGFITFFRSDSTFKKPTVLVMPVTSAGDDHGDELLEVGLADALIHHLASSKDITVRPLSATRSYSGKIADPIQAGREQKVSKVLSASYQRADGKVRVLARLIDVENGEAEDSYKFEVGEKGLFALQDAIAAELGNRIAVRLGAVTGPVRLRETTNEEAFRHYFQGMALFDKRNGLKAVESFDRAIELDPNYARAWAGKAVALGAMPSLGDSTSSELYDKTLHAAERALALDPVSADAYSALCGAKLTYAHDFTGAGEACERAMELAPNSPLVLQNYSFFLIAQGRPDEGVEVIRSALEIEPTSFFSHSLYANSLYLARRYNEAYSQYVTLSELQPDRLPVYEWMIRTLEASGREPEAMDWLLKSLKVRNADVTQIARIEQAYRETGWPGVLGERVISDQYRLNFFRMAGLHARLGNRDAAFELLEKAYEQRPPIYVTLRAEPQLDPLRNDPRFADLVKRMEGESR